MQFQPIPTPHQRGIRRIPTTKLQTMKHIRENCMRNYWVAAGPGRASRRRTEPHISTPGTTGAKGARGTCRSAGGRRRGLAEHTRTTSTTGVEGAGGTCRGAGGRRRGLAGLRDDAPSEARSADGSRAGRRPPAHTAAEPSGAQNTRGAPSNQATTQRKRAAAHRAAARSRSQWNTQRRREATTSATWTALRAAPLRRLSPETTKTRPRLPSTA